ncbi:17304_t:CDS:2 [Funneliformis geosporum]|nr:17304_t:CDS:2 [Funneliformis geosporum]
MEVLGLKKVTHDNNDNDIKRFVEYFHNEAIVTLRASAKLGKKT